VSEIHAEVDRRYREDLLYVALTWAIYAMFGGTSGTVGAPLTQQCADPPGNNSTVGGCNPPTAPAIPIRGDGELETLRPTDTSWDPVRRIRTINMAIDALDDFLFSNPNPTDWHSDETERFLRLKDALDGVCHEDSHESRTIPGT
jgi:hypothetical protein